MRDFNGAEKRPAVTFEIAEREVNGVAHPAIVVPVPSRLTWSLPLPRRAVFQTVVALTTPPPGNAPAPVRLRVGISDHRTFEGLSEVTLNPGSGWTDLRADLSAYAGWKWSLFYKPDRVTWRLNLSADAVGGVPAVALWGRPEIVTDTQSAREYSTRRLRSSSLDRGSASAPRLGPASANASARLAVARRAKAAACRAHTPAPLLPTPPRKLRAAGAPARRRAVRA